MSRSTLSLTVIDLRLFSNEFAPGSNTIAPHEISELITRICPTQRWFCRRINKALPSSPRWAMCANRNTKREQLLTRLLCAYIHNELVIRMETKEAFVSQIYCRPAVIYWCWSESLHKNFIWRDWSNMGSGRFMVHLGQRFYSSIKSGRRGNLMGRDYSGITIMQSWVTHFKHSLTYIYNFLFMGGFQRLNAAEHNCSQMFAVFNGSFVGSSLRRRS